MRDYQKLRCQVSSEEILKLRQEAVAKLQSIYGDADMVIADALRFISGLLKDVLKKPCGNLSLSDKIDKIIVNRWLGIPIFGVDVLGLPVCVYFIRSVYGLIDAFFGWLAAMPLISAQTGWVRWLPMVSSAVSVRCWSCSADIPALIAISILEDSVTWRVPPLLWTD